MKHIISILTIVFGTFVSYASGLDSASNTISNPSIENSALFCSNPCNVADSLALVDLYNNTLGFAWDSTWNLTDCVETWYGITMNASGRVTKVELGTNSLDGSLLPSIGDLTACTELELDANDLDGIIPSTIGNLTNLEILWLDNNEFTGNIPSTFGNLVNVTSLFIDDNRFTGQIPSEIGNMSSLMTFFMDNNCFQDSIPMSMASMSSLIRFEFFNNKISFLPDMSGVALQNNRLKAETNRLTFDDIIPNLGAALADNYFPQDSVGDSLVVTVQTGTTYIIDLGIDEGITSNEYNWYKDGSFHAGPFNINELSVGPIDWTDAGKYTCVITNPNAPLLTLYSRPVTLVVECGTSVNLLDDVLCTGASITINGNVYDIGTPTGTEPAPNDQYGCDSIIQIDLSFQDPPTDTIEQTLCPFGSLLVNGTLYTVGNPTGTEVFVDGIGPGCDSTVFINLTFLDVNDLTGNLTGPFCRDTSFDFGTGLIYDINNTNGFEILPGGSYLGCDSLLVINLTFYPDVIENYNPMLCTGSSVTINGNVYDAATPTGQEVFEN